MQIRDACAEDWRALWSFLHAIVAAGETYAYDPEMTEDEARRIWMVGSPGRTIVALADDGTGVGTANMYANRPGPGSHVVSASFMVDPAVPAAAGRGPPRRAGSAGSPRRAACGSSPRVCIVGPPSRWWWLEPCRAAPIALPPSSNESRGVPTRRRWPDGGAMRRDRAGPPHPRRAVHGRADVQQPGHGGGVAALHGHQQHRVKRGRVNRGRCVRAPDTNAPTARSPAETAPASAPRSRQPAATAASPRRTATCSAGERRVQDRLPPNGPVGSPAASRDPASNRATRSASPATHAQARSARDGAGSEASSATAGRGQMSTRRGSESRRRSLRAPAGGLRPAS